MEMIVSIALIVSITALFIADYRTGNRRSDLTMAAQKLVADLHAAQNNSLGLVKYNAAVPAGGWGVHLTEATSSYVIFADLNAPGTAGYMSYDPESEGNINYGARLDELSPAIAVSSLTMNGATSSAATVTFLPPDPQTNLYNGAATATSLVIQLEEIKTGQTKDVQVNFLGLVEVVD